ncbi:MAG: hypothetical protein H6853_06220 [Rhodospirillales bacterium]|nr:hypothetical protein [Alphaproteobacteria bacterium]USO03132.1 MAG: hypothetical protein H6853_06220 [Rhodospirillales bacterium]
MLPDNIRATVGVSLVATLSVAFFTAGAALQSALTDIDTKVSPLTKAQAADGSWTLETACRLDLPEITVDLEKSYKEAAGPQREKIPALISGFDEDSGRCYIETVSKPRPPSQG